MNRDGKKIVASFLYGFLCGGAVFFVSPEHQLPMATYVIILSMGIFGGK